MTRRPAWTVWQRRITGTLLGAVALLLAREVRREPRSEPAMAHANAALTPRHRLLVARMVVDDGWPIAEVAARFQISWPTVKGWADRYRAGQSMQDRSSRPHHSPNKTNTKTTKRCI